MLKNNRWYALSLILLCFNHITSGNTQNLDSLPKEMETVLGQQMPKPDQFKRIVTDQTINPAEVQKVQADIQAKLMVLKKMDKILATLPKEKHDTREKLQSPKKVASEANVPQETVHKKKTPLKKKPQKGPKQRKTQDSACVGDFKILG